MLPQQDVDRHHRPLARLRLPKRRWIDLVEPTVLWATLAADNKRGYLPCGTDEVPMVLLERVGEPLAGLAGRPLTAAPRRAVAAAWAAVSRLV